ncbi:hypothetical protein KCP69_08575 [Salmonella enterica subsp. enterica]|nr:hypothetical protein KCP69_08575 [Salmonella enterica subsp. enterica]
MPQDVVILCLIAVNGAGFDPARLCTPPRLPSRAAAPPDPCLAAGGGKP